MFSYRHAFHAGNHADVLKHAILVHTLDYFNRKDAPYWVIDTMPAPAWQPGRRLGHQDRRVRRRHRPALGARRPAAHPGRYMQRVRAYNTNGRLRRYPGSPWLTLDALRPSDRLRMFEMHRPRSTRWSATWNTWTATPSARPPSTAMTASKA